MRKFGSRFLQWFLFAALIMLAGCAGNQQGYQKAFDSQNALAHNQYTFAQSPESIFKTVKQTFVQQGFTIESADMKSGIIKAVRDMQDKEEPEISYNIHASADISEVTGTEVNVSLAASQQTILHRATTTWWHLLWIIPIIPTGTEYQTLVIKEGNVTEPGFYTDFFNSLKIAVTKHDLAVKAAAAKAAEKVAAERAAAEQAAKAKAEADRVAAEQAAKARAEDEARAAAKKAEADRIMAEKSARAQGEAEARAAAEEGKTDKVAGARTDAGEPAAGERGHLPDNDQPDSR